MPATLDDFLPGILTLPDDSKLLLVEHLLESIPAHAEPDTDLLAEVTRRRAEAKADPSLLLPGEAVLQEMRVLAASFSQPS